RAAPRRGHHPTRERRVARDGGRHHHCLRGHHGQRGRGDMTTATTGIGLKRLQHLVLWVSNVERSVRFYRDILGFEVKTQSPRAAFLKIPGTADDHNLGLFEQPGVSEPDEHAARMYHSAWEVGELPDLGRAR